MQSLQQNIPLLAAAVDLCALVKFFIFLSDSDDAKGHSMNKQAHIHMHRQTK